MQASLQRQAAVAEHASPGHVGPSGQPVSYGPPQQESSSEYASFPGDTVGQGGNLEPFVLESTPQRPASQPSPGVLASVLGSMCFGSQARQQQNVGLAGVGEPNQSARVVSGPIAPVPLMPGMSYGSGPAAFQPPGFHSSVWQQMLPSPVVPAGQVPGPPPGMPVGAQSSADTLMVLVLQQMNMVQQQHQQNQQLVDLVQQLCQTVSAQQTSQQSVPAVQPSQGNAVGAQSAGSSTGSNGGIGNSAMKAVDAKLIPSMPVCDHSKWVDRPTMIMGFCTWVDSLTSWLSTMAPVYHSEVKEVLRQTTPCDWSKYSSDKKERAQRLYFVLRQSLASFPKAMSLFRIYDLSKTDTNGYEVLRLLKEECGLATRAEALFFRECVLNFRVSSKLGSLRDCITRLEAELLHYNRILETAKDPTLFADLSIGEPDLYRWLLLNLTEEARRFVQLHAGATFREAKAAAIQYYERVTLSEQQFRPGATKSLQEFHLNAMSHKGPGKEKKDPKDVVCFKCNKKGHFARDCPENEGSAKGSWSSNPKGSKGQKGGKGTGKGKAQAKSSSKPSTPRGKGKQKGKKGHRSAELSEVSETDHEEDQGVEPDWSEEDWPESQSVGDGEWSEQGLDESQELRLSVFTVVPGKFVPQDVFRPPIQSLHNPKFGFEHLREEYEHEHESGLSDWACRSLFVEHVRESFSSFPGEQGIQVCDQCRSSSSSEIAAGSSSFDRTSSDGALERPGASESEKLESEAVCLREPVCLFESSFWKQVRAFEAKLELWDAESYCGKLDWDVQFLTAELSMQLPTVLCSEGFSNVPSIFPIPSIRQLPQVKPYLRGPRNSRAVEPIESCVDRVVHGHEGPWPRRPQVSEVKPLVESSSAFVQFDSATLSNVSPDTRTRSNRDSVTDCSSERSFEQSALGFACDELVLFKERSFEQSAISFETDILEKHSFEHCATSVDETEVHECEEALSCASIDSRSLGRAPCHNGLPEWVRGTQLGSELDKTWEVLQVIYSIFPDLDPVHLSLEERRVRQSTVGSEDSLSFREFCSDCDAESCNAESCNEADRNGEFLDELDCFEQVDADVSHARRLLPVFLSPTTGAQASGTQSEGSLNGFLNTSLDQSDMNLAEWWLIDSGASRSVISERFVSQYRVVKSRELPQPMKFTTANGDTVSVNREVVVSVGLELFMKGSLTKSQVQIRAMISPVEHNLLSTSQLCRVGWSVSMTKGGVD